MCIYIYVYIYLASLVAQLVKNLPARQETLVWFLGREDPLEKGTATHSGILQNTGEFQSMELQRLGHDGVTFTSLYIYLLLY